MKSILKAVNTELIGDTILKNELGYTSSNQNIIRFESLKDYNFDTMLLFGKLVGYKRTENLDIRVSSKIRDYELHLQALDRKDDLKVDDIREAAIDVLHNKQLEVSGNMRTMKCEWERSIPIFYEDKIHYYVGQSYFLLTVKDLS